MPSRSAIPAVKFRPIARATRSAARPEGRGAARALRLLVPAGVLVLACASLDTPPEPHPPPCPEGEESRNAVGVVVSKVEARYPRAALRRGEDGFVCMNFTVQADGSVTDICVSEDAPTRLFDREAVAALAQWKFEPTGSAFPSGTCIQFFIGP